MTTNGGPLSSRVSSCPLANEWLNLFLDSVHLWVTVNCYLLIWFIVLCNNIILNDQYEAFCRKKWWETSSQQWPVRWNGSQYDVYRISPLLVNRWHDNFDLFRLTCTVGIGKAPRTFARKIITNSLLVFFILIILIQFTIGADRFLLFSPFLRYCCLAFILSIFNGFPKMIQTHVETK